MRLLAGYRCLYFAATTLFLLLLLHECRSFVTPATKSSGRSLQGTIKCSFTQAPPASTRASRGLVGSMTRRSGSCVMTRGRPLSMGLIHGGGGIENLVSSLFDYNGNVPFVQALGLNAVLFFSLNRKLATMLTPTGFYHAMALGTMLWTTLGWRGWTLCVAYLFLGQLVTKVKFAEKQRRGLAEGRGGRRGPENVWGSAATGLVCAVCSVQGDSFLGIPSGLYLLGYVASLSTKLADTFASEIGKAYGKTTFLITTFRRVEPGTEGAVSLEGTAAAVVGGLLLSLYGYGVVGLIGSAPAVIISTAAAFLATNVESVLGATLQEKEGLEWMTNEVINFLNTLIGAAIAIASGMIFLQP